MKLRFRRSSMIILIMCLSGRSLSSLQVRPSCQTIVISSCQKYSSSQAVAASNKKQRVAAIRGAGNFFTERKKLKKSSSLILSTNTILAYQKTIFLKNGRKPKIMSLRFGRGVLLFWPANVLIYSKR